MTDLVERQTDAQWLLIKRDLYERPRHMGYTGIRDNAGRYSREEANAHAACYGDDHVVLLENAPEFRKATFPDLVQAHLIMQREAQNAEITRLRAEVTDAREASSVMALLLNQERARVKELEAALECVVPQLGPKARATTLAVLRFLRPRTEGEG